MSEIGKSRRFELDVLRDTEAEPPGVVAFDPMSGTSSGTSGGGM